MNPLIDDSVPPYDQILTGHFREGPGYHVHRPRGRQDWLLIYTLSGRGRIGYDGGELHVEPNDLLLLRPHAIHDYGVEESVRRWEPLWAHFRPRPEWEQWLFWPEEAPNVLRLRLNDPATRRRILARFWKAHRFAARALPRRQAFAMNALEELFLWADLANPMTGQDRLDPRIRRAMDHIGRNLGGKLTLDAVAEYTGLSPSRFSHLFRQQTGLAPQQYIERQRLERARQLLAVTDRSIKQIAREVGFDNPFYFTLRFKRSAGLNPTTYRQRLAMR